MTLPSGPFGCILADPPWAFNSWAHDGVLPSRMAASHYTTTETEELEDIPVRKAADKNCALFMWVVDSHFDEALRLGNAWGFQFKTCAFVWVKTRAGGWPTAWGNETGKRDASLPFEAGAAQ